MKITVKTPLAAACFLATASLAPPPIAQEARLTVTHGDEDLRSALSAASLVLDVEGSDAHSAQDYVAAARADYRRMLNALYSQGHYAGKVSIRIDGREAAQIPPLDAPASVRSIEINVDPGPLFTFGQAQIGPLPAGTTPPPEFQPGAPAYSRVVRDATRDAVEAWRRQSHAKARVAGDEIIARHPARKLDARVQLAPGPALRFGPLTISGNENVRTERVRAISGYYEGDRFDPEELERVANRLRRTGTFRSVAVVEAETYTPDLRLPVELLVEERKPRRIGFGVEYSTLDGIGTEAYWLHRNLLGGAETFRVEGEVTQLGKSADDLDYKLGVSFDRPATFGPENTLNFDAEIARIQDPGYDLDRVTINLGITRILRDYLTASAGIGFRAAEVTDGFGTRDYRLLTLPIKATLDRRDDPRDAHEGYYISAELTPFHSLYGSSDGLHGTADARYYKSLPIERQVTFAGRLQLGTLVGPSGNDAPADFLFFSGGGDTVRGHAYQSLGQIVGGAKVGGRSFLGASVEARAQVRGNIGAVAFADYGYISGESTPGQDGNAHAGAGIGLRYDTRLGPIRLDVATPVGYGQTGNDVQVYIGIGQAF